MKGFTLTGVCQFGFFTYLALFSLVSLTSAVSFDLTELRNKVAKIKVNPRGNNLWASGHFMGKKSVLDAPAETHGGDVMTQFPATEQNGDALAEIFQQLFVREALRGGAQVETRENRSDDREEDLLMKILGSYIRNRK